MLKLRLGALAVLAVCAGPSAAEPFIAVTGTSTTTKYEEIKRSFGYAVSAGYQADQLPLFIEGEYYGSGSLKLDDYNDGSTSLFGGRSKYNGFQVFVGGAGRLTPTTVAWLKGGYYNFDGKFHLDGGSFNGQGFGETNTKSTESGLSLGIGIDWMAFNSVGFRAEIETPFKVNTTPGLDSGNDSQLSIIRLGLVWRPAPRQTGSSYGSQTRPSYAPPVAAAAPAAGAPASSQIATTFKPGDEALARPGSVLRASPLESAAVVQNLSPSPLLKLENSIVNATGEWWFVSSDVERGWLRGDQLIKP